MSWIDPFTNYKVEMKKKTFADIFSIKGFQQDNASLLQNDILHFRSVFFWFFQLAGSKGAEPLFELFRRSDNLEPVWNTPQPSTKLHLLGGKHTQNVQPLEAFF
jgi:hypothetical protein